MELRIVTRINCGIPPVELNNQHLIAETREIKRIPNCVSKGKFNLKDQPLEFKLGTGHVKFFYTRLGYLKKRYEELYKECLRRGFNVQYYGSAWDNVPIDLMGNYEPSDRDREIIRERIFQRLNKRELT